MVENNLQITKFFIEPEDDWLDCEDCARNLCRAIHQGLTPEHIRRVTEAIDDPVYASLWLDFFSRTMV